jgi:hypothetical protein
MRAPGCLAGVLRSSSARSRSINGTERSKRRRAAIRALQPHRRNARFAAGLPPIEKPPTNRSFWFVLLLIVAVSLSGPLWRPCTGALGKLLDAICEFDRRLFICFFLGCCLRGRSNLKAEDFLDAQRVHASLE